VHVSEGVTEEVGAWCGAYISGRERDERSEMCREETGMDEVDHICQSSVEGRA